MRLCERDGAFDFAAYGALSTDVTWEEALRINAALVVIGDERAAYGEWRTKDASAQRKHPTGGPTPALTLDDYKRELDLAREDQDKAQQMLVLHRRAVVGGVDEGRLSDARVVHFETIVNICKTRIEAIEAHVVTLMEEMAGKSDVKGAKHV